jgi:peptidyl-tRNA hydrolase
MYVVIRKDLKPGLMLAQGIHAAILFNDEHSEIAKEWHQQSDYLAVLEAQNEAELLYFIDMASADGIKYSVFREPDLNNQITAATFEPGERTKRMLRLLPLAMKDLK